MLISSRQDVLQNKTIFISCIVPVYNEESVITEFLSELLQTLQNLTTHFEIIVIDDGSVDQTVQKLMPFIEQGTVKLLALSRNFGKEAALTAGIDHCQGEVAILLDADFQHPLDMLPVFLSNWASGYDMVYGVRRDRMLDTSYKRIFARLFYTLMHQITKEDIPANAGDFRLLDKKIVQALRSFPERTRFMKGLYSWVGYPKLGVPFVVKKRAGGKTSWGFFRLTELAITGITSFSDVPLRVWSVIGSIISFLALLYAIYILITTLIFGADLPGFPTLIVAIVFFGGIQLLSVGILGEYIARIFTEVKQRPTYLLQTKIGFDEEPK